jgi:hypothetical protein
VLSICVRIDLASQETFAQRAEWNEADPKLLKGWHQCLFRLAPEQRVLALKCSDRLNCMGPANCVCARFRKTEVLHLAFLNQILDSARNIFDRNIQVDPMLIEEINGTDLETIERLFCNLLDVLRSAVESVPLATVAGVGLPPEFRRDDDFAAKRRQGFTDKFFIEQRAVDLSGIEEGDSPLYGGVRFITGPSRARCSSPFGPLILLPTVFGRTA